MSDPAKIKKEIKVLDKHKYQITIEFKGNEYPIELDKTPHRHSGESMEDYRERRKTVKYFETLRKKEYIFKGQTNVEKILGLKGETYKKESNG